MRGMLLVLSVIALCSCQKASPKTIHDLEVLKPGWRYSLPIVYCHRQDDLRLVIAENAVFGGEKALEMWRDYTTSKKCIEDPLNKATRFTVVGLSATYQLPTGSVYIIEIEVDGIPIDVDGQPGELVIVGIAQVYGAPLIGGAGQEYVEGIGGRVLKIEGVVSRTGDLGRTVGNSAHAGP